ncbi:dual specificity phosphatase, catalytic domain-containing protein [Toxoplasma gondii TgCatPRC2]|uniref:Dual specificity phosphatase, catalytic domain-containing protein n=1 Tax=Toxoplasma gondii TgCatPRC2 TaxID=1130821 RepID=A0A151HIE0_TOXGO|nr:dual specificity phosphatase, catalytic domain-containing protein [Toxoplasma gondii TgCatPRC2]
MEVAVSSSGPSSLRPVSVYHGGASGSEDKKLWIWLPYISALSRNGFGTSNNSQLASRGSLRPSVASMQSASSAVGGSLPGVSSSVNTSADETWETVRNMVVGRPVTLQSAERIRAGSAPASSLMPKCPTDIYPPGLVPTLTKGSLFVGSLKHALDENLLLKFNVKLVVTVAWPYGSWPLQQRVLYSRLGISHINHPLLDSPSQELDFSRLSLARIHSYLARGVTVLVHCEKGISRSVSLCAAYLIVYHGHTTMSALEAIRKYRPIARPNPGFFVQLQRLESNHHTVAASFQNSSNSPSRRSPSRVDWPHFHCFPTFSFPCRPEGSCVGSKEERIMLMRQGTKEKVLQSGKRADMEL